MEKAIKTFITLIIITGAFGLVGFVLANNKKNIKAQTAIVAAVNADVAVRTDTVKKEKLALDFVSNGNSAAFREINFAAENPGRVVNIFVKEGTYVAKGQLLATVKTDELSVDLDNARAVYQNALADKERYENAFKTDGVTRQQVDQANLALQNAQAKMRQAGIKINEANIRSSINGIVNKRYIEPGAVLAPGTQMFDIVDVSKLKLDFTVNESQVVNVKTGDEVKVTASVYPDKTFTGRVSFIAPKSDGSLNFPVEIQIQNNPSYELKAGMYGTAVFQFPNQQPVTVIKRDAFADSVSSNQVFVVDRNSTARLRKVTSGRIVGDKVEVLNGLNENETVITSGQINVSDGTKVQAIK